MCKCTPAGHKRRSRGAEGATAPSECLVWGEIYTSALSGFEPNNAVLHCINPSVVQCKTSVNRL